MSDTTISRPIEVSAKTTFSLPVRPTISGSRPGSFLAMGEPRGRHGAVQMLKKISGIATMYFRLRVQRSTILIGSEIMASSRITNMP